MKKIELFLVVLFFMFLCAACGTAGDRQEERTAVSGNSQERSFSSVNKPAWADASDIDEGNCIAFIGSSTNTRTEEESKQSAISNALQSVSKYFGVSVSAKFSEKRSKINGKRDSQIFSEGGFTAKKIEVKEFNVEDSVTNRTKSGYVSYVKVAVPKSELARIRIELDGFGVWAIQSDLPQCEKKIRDLFPIFGKYGININEQIDYSFKTPDQVYRENSKMFYLKVECNDVKSEEYNGEFYSLIQISAELFNLMTGETINRWTAEGKGAAYSMEDAQNTGILKALNEIGGQISNR